MKDNFKTGGLILIMIIIIYHIRYFLNNIVPTLKGECTDINLEEFVEYSLIDFSFFCLFLLVVSFIGFGTFYLINKIPENNITVLLGSITLLVLGLLTICYWCLEFYVQYQFCGQVNSIEYLMKLF